MAFDLRKAELTKKHPILVGGRSKPWSKLAPRWFANATISRPHPSLIRMPYLTARRVEDIIKRARQEPEAANAELNQLYQGRMSEAVDLVRKTFAEPNASVVFEENGTSALALLRNLLAGESDEIVTTSDEGRLVVDALKGQEFVTRRENFRNPLGFFKPPEHIEAFSGKVTQVPLFDGKKPKTNEEILDEIVQLVKERQPPVVIVPHVSRTGRILPVEEIGRAIQAHNRRASRPTHYIVDGIQAVGRLPHAEITRPLSYADAYVFTSAKALGASMQGATVMRRQMLDENVERLLDSKYAPRICFDQFHDEPDAVHRYLEARDKHYRVSLPEVHAMSEALREYLSRRENEEEALGQIERERRSILASFRGNPHIKVLKPGPGTPLTPSIVTFELKHPEITTEDLKRALQSREDPITLPALISDTNHLRIGLSEITPRSDDEIKELTHTINSLVSDDRPIVLMPGSFDPITRGHQHNLQQLLDNPHYKRVLLLPTQHYRSKTKKLVASKSHRRNMAGLLVKSAGHPRLRLDVSDLEYSQRKRINWHLERLAKLNPGSEIVLAVGSRAFGNFVDELKKHHSWQNLPIRLGFHVFFRTAEGTTPSSLASKDVERKFNEFKVWLGEQSEKENEAVRARITVLTTSDKRHSPTQSISSTQVRNAIREGKPFEQWVPPEVADYIHAHGVYPHK